jgi:hypothetical protein
MTDTFKIFFRPLTRAQSSFLRLTPDSASLHPGLYAAAIFDGWLTITFVEDL